MYMQVGHVSFHDMNLFDEGMCFIVLSACRIVSLTCYRHSN